MVALVLGRRGLLDAADGLVQPPGGRRGVGNGGLTGGAPLLSGRRRRGRDDVLHAGQLAPLAGPPVGLVQLGKCEAAPLGAHLARRQDARVIDPGLFLIDLYATLPSLELGDALEGKDHI